MRKFILAAILIMSLAYLVVAQQPSGTPPRNFNSSYAQPYLSGIGSATLSYSSGAIFTPAKQAITAGTLTSFTASQGTCTAAAILGATDACEYIYWHSSTGLSASTTYATAAAAGNVLVGFVTTDSASKVVAIYPATAVGPLGISPTAANLSGTLLGTSYFAGSVITGAKIAGGICVLGTSCSVTMGPTYTGTTTYSCTGTDQTSAAAVKVVNTSQTAVTFTGTGTDTIAWHCYGN